MPRSLLTITLPFVFIGALQLVSCSPKEIPPAKPGGAYLSVSGGAEFDQSVDIVDEDDQVIGYIDTMAITSIYRPRHEESTIYLTGGKTVVSTNGGDSWKELNIPLARVSAFVDLTNGTWLASGTNEDSEGIVIRSLDKGESWNNVLNIPSTTKQESKKFQIIKPPPAPSIVVSSLVPDPFYAERVYATTSTGDVLIGEESGKVWRIMVRISATKSDPFTGHANTPVKKIIPSIHNAGEVMLISGEGGLIRATEQEQELLTIPPGAVADVSYIKQFPEALFVSMTTGIYVTRDKGKSWDELGVPISKAQPLKNSTVRVSPSNPNRLLVTVNNIIFRSEDGGKNWNTLSLDLPNHIITDLSINPENASRVIISTVPFKT